MSESVECMRLAPVCLSLQSPLHSSYLALDGVWMTGMGQGWWADGDVGVWISQSEVLMLDMKGM